MKVIDLLNKIANGEDVPKKFKYCDEIYKMTKVLKDNGEYWYNYINEDTTCLLFDNSELNNEIEIIEDTPKEDKKIEKLDDYDFDIDLEPDTKCECLRNRLLIIEDKINEIIDRLNNLLAILRGEDNE